MEFNMGYIIVGIIITVALFFVVLGLFIGAEIINKVIEYIKKGKL